MQVTSDLSSLYHYILPNPNPILSWCGDILLPVTTNTGKPSARGLAQEQGLAITVQGQGLDLTAQGPGLAPSAQGHGLVVPMDLANAQHFMEGLVQVDSHSPSPLHLFSFIPSLLSCHVYHSSQAILSHHPLILHTLL